MSDHFLEDQLKRIKEMTEQMTRLQNSTAELSGAFERDRVMVRNTPLHEVRDFRTSLSPSERARAGEHARRPSRPGSRGRRR